MKISKRILLAAAIATLFAGAALAQTGLVTSDPVAAVDNIPPAPITNLQALDASDTESQSVLITWSLSEDDAVTYSTFGDGYVPRGGVRGYNIYRRIDNGSLELLQTVAPGVSEYVDETVEKGKTYVYSVNPFDQDNETGLGLLPGSAEDLARIVLVGGSGGGVIIVAKIKGVMTFATELDFTDQAAVDDFSARFVTHLSTLLGIDPARIKVTAIRAGSVVVEFEVIDLEEPGDEPTAAAALEQLFQQIEADSQVLSDLGTVSSLVDESGTEIITKVNPLDPDGNEIFGWFTHEGSTVDFDDFFLFADHFGETATSAAYDDMFDLIDNDTIDFDDFFLFADHFGKVVANADQVRLSLGL